MLKMGNASAIIIANSTPHVVLVNHPCPDVLEFDEVFELFGNSLQVGNHFLGRDSLFGMFHMYSTLLWSYRVAHGDRIRCDRDPAYPSSRHVSLKYRGAYACGEWGQHIHDVLDAGVPTTKVLVDKRLVLTGPAPHTLDHWANDRKEQFIRGFAST